MAVIVTHRRHRNSHDEPTETSLRIERHDGDPMQFDELTSNQFSQLLREFHALSGLSGERTVEIDGQYEVVAYTWD